MGSWIPARRLALRRVLIVVSAWEPAIVADMQRARMLAWDLPRLGWQVEVLTPSASEVRQDILEPGAGSFFAPGTPVHHVGSLAAPIWKALGSSTHSWRTLLPLAMELRRLLRSGRFDLVYFSTTTFIYFALGPHVCRPCSVPYVLDFHDPWVKERGPRTPPKSFRSRLSERLGESLEHAAVTQAAGIVAVSPTYLEVLRARYPGEGLAWADARCHATIPFGARTGDFESVAAQLPLSRMPTRPGARNAEIVVNYVGAGGAIMQRGWQLVCAALEVLRQRGDERVARLRVRLFGTTYGWKPGEPRLLQAIADEAGIGALVEERPERIGYRASLETLLAGDGVLVLGVDDLGYMPSKLFSYSFSGKPLLAVLRRDGPAYRLMMEYPGVGNALWISETTAMPTEEAVAQVESFLESAGERRTIDRGALLAPFLAGEMARRHVALFDACLEGAPS